MESIINASKENNKENESAKPNPIIENIKSRYILSKIFDIMPKKKKITIVKYNKRIQNIYLPKKNSIILKKQKINNDNQANKCCWKIEQKLVEEKKELERRLYFKRVERNSANFMSGSAKDALDKMKKEEEEEERKIVEYNNELNKRERERLIKEEK